MEAALVPVETGGMVLICAWCNRTLRRGTGQVSHGICTRCSEIVESRVVGRWAGPARRRAREVAVKLPLPGFEVANLGRPVTTPA
jgi:hypothetical protein